MIHDIILSCLNLHSKQIQSEEFVVSDAICNFFHPCEKILLNDINRIVNLLREVAKFSKVYGNNQNIDLNGAADTDEPLQTGLYIKAFANGIELVLDDYLNDLTELENKFLRYPCQSLMFIYQKLYEYEPLALNLTKLIRGIRMQKLHGCAIIQYLQLNSFHGDARIKRAVKIIQSAVNVVFLKQLTHWILYAKLVDSYGEFFIQYAEIQGNTAESEKGTSISSGKYAANSISEVTSTYTDIWRYEINYEFLPNYLSTCWAEKVLFIGQTVLICKVDTNKFSKNAQIWNKTETSFFGKEQSIWNKKEHAYFEKIQALHFDPELNVPRYEHTIDEIKSYVTTRLSEIAVNHADLVQQLKLIKDFYLLGRGELFLEFIRQTYIISKDTDNENKHRDFVKAFESAAHGVGVLSEEMEQFSLCIPKSTFDSDAVHEFGYLQLIQLQYKINWPLHLLFSPKVLERYNILFRFLLLIKKIQYELHMLWSQHARESKLKTNLNIRTMHFRNELMFFVNNLQYYIQVDVLESQFSILLNTILNKADFEQIQRSHSIFQANILSLCFLLNDEEANKLSILQSSTTNSSNPVYLIINEILHICQDFCTLVDNQINNDILFIKINELSERFGSLIQQLINLLVGLKTTTPSITPLSQLLLRLDFNHWFSIKKKIVNE